MTHSTTDDDGDEVSTTQAFVRLGICTAVVAILFIGMTAPAAAQTATTVTTTTTSGGGGGGGSSGNVVCSMPNVTPLLNTGFKMFMWGALVIGFFTWIATSATESLPVPRDVKKSIKRQRNGAAMSAGRAIFVPGIVLAVLGTAGIGVPSCFSVVPFTAVLF